MKQIFPSDYASIMERMDRIDTVWHGECRNFVDGAVTYLSPYISKGVHIQPYDRNDQQAKGRKRSAKR